VDGVFEPEGQDQESEEPLAVVAAAGIVFFE
jgi:hypothetical protein